VKLIVISDLHLIDSKDPMYARLLSFMNSHLESGDHFVFAGDIFDFMVGNLEYYYSEYHELWERIHQYTQQGVRFSMIEGNHDFGLQSFIHKVHPSIQYSTDHIEVSLGQKKYWIEHGDLANPYDRSYLLLRAFFRSWFIRSFVMFCPESILRAMGRKLSQLSSDHNPRLPTQALSESQLQALREIYRNSAWRRLEQGYDGVIMGHCHDADEFEWNIQGQHKFYANMGYPKVHGYAIVVEGEQPFYRRVNLDFIASI
jgi:UDP-2,3-diacylglucosamine pyrophosphatase LpxH